MLDLLVIFEECNICKAKYLRSGYPECIENWNGNNVFFLNFQKHYICLLLGSRPLSTSVNATD
jgi:hypothetical protein